MRVCGYTREEPPVAAAEPAFAQSEQIRRFATERGWQLVAVCSDGVVPGGADISPGFQALLAVAESGTVDAVVVASLSALAGDVEGQEILLRKLRSSGTTVFSADPADDKELAAEPADPDRLAVRAVLARADEVEARLSG